MIYVQRHFLLREHRLATTALLVKVCNQPLCQTKHGLNERYRANQRVHATRRVTVRNTGPIVSPKWLGSITCSDIFDESLSGNITAFYALVCKGVNHIETHLHGKIRSEIYVIRRRGIQCFVFLGQVCVWHLLLKTAKTTQLDISSFLEYGETIFGIL